MDKFIFEPEPHKYTLNSIVIPGVSEILKANGLDFFSKVRPDVLSAAQKFGTAVHRATALWDKQDLAIDMLSEPLKPYLNAWIKFKKDSGYEIWAIEQPIYSKKLWVAGTPDRIGKLKKPGVLDIKVDNEYEQWVALQLAFYLTLWNERHPDQKIKERLAVILSPDKYRIEEYKDPTDFDTIMAMRRIYEYKKRHNLLRG